MLCKPASLVCGESLSEGLSVLIQWGFFLHSWTLDQCPRCVHDTVTSHRHKQESGLCNSCLKMGENIE